VADGPLHLDGTDSVAATSAAHCDDQRRLRPRADDAIDG
jgi:hypothetical protein